MAFLAQLSPWPRRTKPQPPTNMASEWTTFTPPVALSTHGFLALVLLMAGFLFTALYCINPLGLGGKGKGAAAFLLNEVPMAAIASVLLGAGVVFLFLWAGIYV